VAADLHAGDDHGPHAEKGTVAHLHIPAQQGASSDVDGGTDDGFVADAGLGADDGLFPDDGFWSGDGEGVDESSGTDAGPRHDEGGGMDNRGENEAHGGEAAGASIPGGVIADGGEDVPRSRLQECRQRVGRAEDREIHDHASGHFRPVVEEAAHGPASGVGENCQNRPGMTAGTVEQEGQGGFVDDFRHDAAPTQKVMRW
jgi:hypothetical protein